LKTLHETMRLAAILATGGVLVAVAGCAEVTFKRGAGPGEMQASEQACREKTATVEAYKACLHAAGFVYAKPSGDSALFVEDEPTPGTEIAAAASATPSDATASATSAAGEGAPTVSVEPSGRAGQSLAQAARPKANVPSDPLKQITVASWWKLGGTAGGLAADQSVCGDSLGAAHRAAANSRLVTVGMLRCLKGKGWFAVGR
jgi:hypothetical protein